MIFGNGTGRDVRDMFGSFGAAADSLFAKKGHEISAGGYRQAAAMSRQNEEYSIMSTEIKKSMSERNIFKVMGGQQADIASSGFAASGSALDIMRASAQEGELTQRLIDIQGDIELNNFKMQTFSYIQQAESAEAASDRSGLSAIINGVAGLASLAAFVPTGGMSTLFAAGAGSMGKGG